MIEKEYLTITEACQMTGIKGKHQLYNMIKDGTISNDIVKKKPTVKIAKSWVDSYIKENKIEVCEKCGSAII